MAASTRTVTPSCSGCSSDCECGERAKWSDYSLLGKRLSEDSSRHELLQKWADVWRTVSLDSSGLGGEGEKARRDEAAEPGPRMEEERPLVFLCGGCRRPLGDSLSWVTSHEDSNCILLRSQLQARGFGPAPELLSPGRRECGRGGRGGRSETGALGAAFPTPFMHPSLLSSRVRPLTPPPHTHQLLL